MRRECGVAAHYGPLRRHGPRPNLSVFRSYRGKSGPPSVADMQTPLSLAALDQRILAIQANLRDLVEQETARSGAADEDRGDDLIREQETELAALLAHREALAK